LFVVGFCLKTKTDTGNKVFINVCHGANVSDDYNPYYLTCQFFYKYSYNHNNNYIFHDAMWLKFRGTACCKTASCC